MEIEKIQISSESDVTQKDFEIKRPRGRPKRSKTYKKLAALKKKIKLQWYIIFIRLCFIILVKFSTFLLFWVVLKIYGKPGLHKMHYIGMVHLIKFIGNLFVKVAF